MKVAVLSLTRDRLAYSRHCFARLRELAGIPFDHFVFDNGSTDGTYEWLRQQFDTDDIAGFGRSTTNGGIHRAFNWLLDEYADGYDVVVTMDNDCELTVPGTLRAVAELHHAHPQHMIGPKVLGLRHPPPHREFVQLCAEVGDPDPPLASEKVSEIHNVAITGLIGSILSPVPKGWRFDESQPPWGGDEPGRAAYVHARGGIVGQLLDYPVNHYPTTDAQHVDYPAYFARRVAEGGPP